MLISIHFNNQKCSGDIKDNNIGTDHVLTFDWVGQFPQKVIPKMLFFFCHFPAQTLRIGLQVWFMMVVFIHKFFPCFSDCKNVG